MPLDIDDDEFAELVAAAVSTAVAPLYKRIKTIEAKPDVSYEGVHVDGRSYKAGSLVTRAGSLWCATATTDGVPGVGGSSWRLIVKQGKA
jgi:hypothetical protein